MTELTNDTFNEFLLSNRLFITPDDIGLEFSENLDVLRDQLQVCKNLASDIRRRLERLSREQRVGIFRRKMRANELFEIFDSFNGGDSREFLDLEDVSMTIDYRNPDRTFKIPHTTYRVLFSRYPPIYLKVMPRFRYDECFIEFADTVGIPNYYLCEYYDRDPMTYWLLIGEVPEATNLQEVPPTDLNFYQNSIIRGIGEQLALIHILSAGDFDFLVTDGRVVSIDHEFLFNEKDYSETDVKKGKSVSHNLRRFPGPISGNLLGFIDAYMEVWERVESRKGELDEILSIYENPAASNIVERTLERGPIQYLDTELYYILDWRKRETYFDYWLNANDPSYFIDDSDDLERRAYFILNSRIYPDERRMWELSLDDDLLEIGYNLIERGLGEKELRELRRKIRHLNFENRRIFQSLREVYTNG